MKCCRQNKEDASFEQHQCRRFHSRIRGLGRPQRTALLQHFPSQSYTKIRSIARLEETRTTRMKLPRRGQTKQMLLTWKRRNISSYRPTILSAYWKYLKRFWNRLKFCATYAYFWQLIFSDFLQFQQKQIKNPWQHQNKNDFCLNWNTFARIKTFLN